MLNALKQSRWFKIATNKFVVTGLPFLVWMFFFDANSYMMQRELNGEISKLKQSIGFYQSELETDRVALHELESDPKAFEKYAREKFWMHKEGEEIYVFEFHEKGD